MIGHPTDTIQTNATPLGTPPVSNRRVEERHPCSRMAGWRRLGVQDGASGVAEVWDLSRRGLGMIVNTSLQRGDILGVTLGDGFERLVRVRRTDPQPDGIWLAGGTFVTALREEELQALLEPAATP